MKDEWTGQGSIYHPKRCTASSVRGRQREKEKYRRHVSFSEGLLACQCRFIIYLLRSAKEMKLDRKLVIRTVDYASVINRWPINIAKYDELNSETILHTRPLSVSI